MPHFFIKSEANNNNTIVISDKENYVHIARALRARVNERLLLIDENKIQYETQITEITKDSIVVRVINSYESKRDLTFDLFLAQSPLRSDAQSLVMEKANELLRSVMEYSVSSEEMGRYFDTAKAPYSWFSYKIPTQVMVIEALTRMGKDKETVEEMKRWLLKQKQVQAWDMPIATVDAVYALLQTGDDWLKHASSAEIVLGEEVIQVSEQHALGYLKEEVDGDVTTIENVVVRKKSDGMAWGAVYAQYLEQMDKVENFSNALSVSRTLLKNGAVVSPDVLKVGDRITVRLTISVDRDMDFVQIKDERAACMEPVDVLSSYCWRNGVGYYQVTKDASTYFYFDQLRKGKHVLEYDTFIMAEGVYLQGIVSAQSVYAPEFGGYSVSQRMRVK